jgi:hypothetical protein
LNVNHEGGRTPETIDQFGSEGCCPVECLELLRVGVGHAAISVPDSVPAWPLEAEIDTVPDHVYPILLEWTGERTAFRSYTKSFADRLVDVGTSNTTAVRAWVKDAAEKDKIAL